MRILAVSVTVTSHLTPTSTEQHNWPWETKVGWRFSQRK